MPISSTTTWEVRTTGNDNNGGAFDTSLSGVDYSQQDAAHVVIDGTTITGVLASGQVLTLSGYTVHANDAGNHLNVTGGTMTAGTYRIASVNTGTNQWTLDRSAGSAAQTCVGNMGGAKGSLGAVSLIAVTGNFIWVKSGTYTLTTSTAGPAGPITFSNIQGRCEGYQTTRGDMGTPPVIDAGAITAITLFTWGSTGSCLARNIKVDGQGNASVVGFDMGTSRTVGQLLQAVDCTTGFTNGHYSQCYASGCSVAGFGAPAMTNKCVAYNNATGFGTTNGDCISCIAYDNTGDGFIGNTNCHFIGCVAYSNGGDGFDMSTSTGSIAYDCISVGNTGYGFNGNAASARGLNNATYNNTAGALNGTGGIFLDMITLSADPFTNAAGGDFSLNTAAGGGALLRGLGLDTYGQTDNKDIGAVQHADPVASGGGYYLGGSL